MKKKANEIYEKFFAQEYDNIWFTSDEHYENIYTDDPDDVCRHIVLSKRRIFKNTKEMVRGLILNFNQMVGENDLTFHLGDFGSIDLLKNSYLNGDHIILPGNYELEGKYFEGAERDTVFEGLSHYAGKPKRYLIRSDPGFMIPIANFPKYFDPNMIEDIDVLYLTHKPEDHCPTFMQADVDLSRSNYLKTNQELSELQKEAANMMMILGRVNQETGKLFLRVMNLFGHIHEKGKIKEYGFNVGVDANCFLPVPPEDVKFYIHAILHYYDNNVFN